MATSPCSLIIVEDEPLISMMIQEMAEEIGWAVEGVALDENEALTLLAATTPRLALLDINLRGSSGLPVAAWCRERNIPVVFITGYDLSEVPSEFAGSPVLTKPVTSADLERAVRRALGIDRQAPPAVAGTETLI